MNKRNVLILLIVLGGTAYYLNKRTGSGTIDPALVQFAVADTAAIDRIFLADRNGHNIKLDRKGPDIWVLNDGYKARQDAVSLLLATIMKVEMKMPVPKSAHNNVVRLLAGTATKVEVYQHGDLVKTYYVGDATTDHEGTYMIIEGKDVPFICHIPGFHGWLTPRYFTRKNEWRDSEIFRYPRLADIRQVKVTSHQNPSGSFELTRDPDGRFHLRPNGSLIDLGPLDTNLVRMYLHEFSNVRFERAAEIEKLKTDSIVASPPYYTIEVADVNNRKSAVTTYRIKAQPGALNINDQPLEWDTDRMHAMLNNDRNELVVVQYFVFDRLTVPPTAFLKRP